MFRLIETKFFGNSTQHVLYGSDTSANPGPMITSKNRTDNLASSINATGSVGNLAYTWDANKNKLTETISNVPAAVSNYGFTSGTSYDFEDRLSNTKSISNPRTL